MNDTYLKLAEGFEQLAQGYRALAGEPERTSTLTQTHNRLPGPSLKPGKSSLGRQVPRG